MLENVLTSVRINVSRTTRYLIGSHQVTRSNSRDFAVICNGLVLFCGILLDINDVLESHQKRSGIGQRILSMRLLRGESTVDLTPTLVFLDELDNWLLGQLSGSDRFKGGFPHGIVAPNDCNIIMSLVRGIIRVHEEGRLTGSDAVRYLHQIFCFLKKLEINRPDLECAANAEFIRFEAELEEKGSITDPRTLAFIAEMNVLARKHLGQWKPTVITPKHGPGAVADPNVKSWTGKFHEMHTDTRIEYLLNRYGLGTQKDYNPLVKPEKSTRTSRFISVPKTWKTLRGISAEPIELQFYQQAILQSLDDYFQHDKWWNKRVNLHDQSSSRTLAISASATGRYATIDLSAASDSVTLELVKRVLKGTHLLYWLLGTRSTHSLCDDKLVKLRKFAPMGSATCFPVECIIFTLAAQVVSDRNRIPGLNENSTVRVFGDDIIVDYFCATDLIEALGALGFRVNTRKSYWTGCFREACGAEAYLGAEINPLRYKALTGDLNSWRPLSSDISCSISYANSLFDRDFRRTRSYLLSSLQQGKIRVGRRDVVLGPYIHYSFDGNEGSVSSTQPTNFNIVMKFRKAPHSDLLIPWYQQRECRTLVFRLKFLIKETTLEMTEAYELCKYNSWLIDHQVGVRSLEREWTDGMLVSSIRENMYTRLPIGSAMVPTIKWGPAPGSGVGSSIVIL